MQQKPSIANIKTTSKSNVSLTPNETHKSLEDLELLYQQYWILIFDYAIGKNGRNTSHRVFSFHYMEQFILENEWGG